MRLLLIGALLWLASNTVYAQSIVHILSPWANDPSLVDNRHHLYGGATGYSASNDTKMTAEGGGWYSFSWPAGRTFSWEDISLRNCPVASDQNCNGGAYWVSGSTTIKPILKTLFTAQSEIWIYPDAAASGFFRIALDPPGSKFVWFKSPWGNRVLPNMIVGADTVRMRQSYNDPARCGWFYGAVRPGKSSSVFFQRPHTNWTLPASGTLDAAAVFAAKDSAYVDGTSDPLVVAADLGSAGTCFDSSRTVHILNSWTQDAKRRDMPLYVSADNNIQNSPVIMDSAGEIAKWWKYSFTPAQAANSFFAGSKLSVVSYYPKANEGTLTFKFKPTMPALFPAGEYEVWLIPTGDSSVRYLRVPPHPRYIQMMNPWSATTPSLLFDGDTLKMGRVDGKCGWYKTMIYHEPASWDALVKQTIGKDVYSASGLSEGAGISLDSIFKAGDSAWILPAPFPNGPPVLSSHFPEQLGDCGERSLAVMVLDWLGEGEDGSGGNGNTEPSTGKNTKDTDFGGVYSSTGNQCQGLVTGMVETALGANGVPVKKTVGFPVACTASNEMDKWFIPQKITGDYTNATCRDIPLALDDEGFWLADYYEDEKLGVPGFFPVDDFKTLDKEGLVPNPKWEGLKTGWRGTHNFSFSMVVQAEFEYVKGQYFEFRGDDDVWVFINNKLVVDIGGVHGPLPGTVDLDTIGVVSGEPLKEGETYPFHIFFAERNCCGSNFMMRTSMDLQTSRTYYPIQVDAPSGQTRYEVWQILKEESLACNFNGAADEKVDTVKAASNFTLYGAQFGTTGKSLVSGVNYGGINIDADFAAFTIDTSAIMRERALAPGMYRLVFSHSLDPNLTSEIRFTVPSYPLPDIAFADSLWMAIDPDTVKLGEWAFVPYPVRIMAQYMGVPCADCTDKISLLTSDSLVFLDAERKVITSVTLDSGRAIFWVMSKKSLESASFRARSTTVTNELLWKNISFKEPPVPVLDLASMHDRTGDGIPDSLYLGFSRPLKGKDAVDSLFWRWGDDRLRAMDSLAVSAILTLDSTLVLTRDTLMSSIATGSKDGVPYKGTVSTWFTYVPTSGSDSGKVLPFEITGAIEDRVGPVILSAQIAPGKNMDTLSIFFSESLRDSAGRLDSLVNVVAWRLGVERSNQAVVLKAVRRSAGNRLDLFLNNTAPVVFNVGDSVRLAPGLASDYSGNHPHALNPWVRIVGKQRSSVETPGVVTIDPDKVPSENAPVVAVVRVPVDKSIQQVVEEQGVPGHLIRFDLGNLLNGVDTTLVPDDIELVYETYYFSNLGQYINHGKGSVKCSDPVVFEGDCSTHPGNVFLAWNPRDEEGRLVGTGAYVSTLDYKVRMRTRIAADKSDRSIIGIRRE